MRSYGWRSPATRAAAPAAPGAAIHDSTIRIATTSAPAMRGRAALLGSVWLGALAMLAPNAAHAVDGTWTAPPPNPKEWTQGTNWSSSPTVPDVTATFTNNGAATSVTISSPTSIGTIQFTAGAPAYSFAVNGGATLFEINGSGIVNGSASAPSFTNNGAITFTNSSSAGNSAIINNGGGPTLVSFTDTSTANNATITTNGGALTQFTSNSNGGNARFITNAGGIVNFSGTSGPLSDGRITAGSIEGAGTYRLGSNELTVGSNDLSTTLSGSIQDGGAGGSLVKDGSGTLTLTGSSNIGGTLTLCSGCGSGGLTISGGSFTVGSFVEIDGGTLAVTNGGTLQTTDILVAGNMIVTGAGSTVTASGVTVVGFFGPGSLTIANGGVFNSQGGSEIDTFVPELGIPSVLVTGPGSTWNVGGPALFVGGGSTEGPGMLTVANGGTVNATAPMFIGDVTGASTVTVTGAGSVLNALNSLTIGGDNGCGCNLVGTLTIADGGVVNSPGRTSIAAGSTLNLGIGGLAGGINTPAIANDGQIIANFTDTLTLAAVISGTGALSKAGPGTLILTGNNSYSGATTIDGGTLIVNGSIANSPVTVNAGGTLAGTGTVGPTTINGGGTFAPGNSPGTMTVAGNLAFQSGALYVVQVTPSTASSTNVTAAGGATLAGTVQAVFAPGSYVSRHYTILSAAGGRIGTFNALTTTNLPAGFSASLSYTATDAILNLTAALGGLSTLGVPNAPSTCAFNINQCNVANALNAFFNNGGTLPPAFVTIFGLTGGNLANALTLLSGEAATGAQQAAFQLTNQFLGIMLDPFVDGRNSIAGAGGPALGFAPEREELPDDIALAYAKVLKAPPKPASFEQRWSVWGAGYGGGNRTSGDPAVVGSHDLSARTAGGAAGLDYHLSRDSVVGVALAGGGTNWSLAQGLGGGKSDAFQAGLYGTTRWGAAYVAAALAFTNHWMSTDRFAFAGDHLSASFNAQSFGGRVESGYRFATIYGGLTPYAAIQAQSFHTPSYSEADLNAGGFALGYNSRSATDTRSELGGRFDRLLLLNPEAALTLRARVAWAHDWVSDPTLAAVFQALPGASFIVNGATPAKNSALTSAGAELRLANGVSLLAKFDGEFASHATTYAGTGTVRYTW
jgi:autotransporter-associated beta strand protein/T5SS/PEP-CTERM-associated repeat protein